MPSDINDIQLHHESVRDIIGVPPHWLIRWGETIFLGVILFALITTVFVKYPETINGSFKVLYGEDGAPYGELRLSQYNFGKVKVGSDVLISLLSYNKDEFGQIAGEVVSIASKTESDMFVLDVDIKSDIEQLKTKGVVLRDGMLGEGKVVISEERLINRFINKGL